jgi:diguanylate cyclase (GGDEF)-like protein
MIHETTRELVLAIVDDDELCRQQIAELLTQADRVHVLQAASGDALLALLASHTVDCIVLDYDLGGETGLAVGEAIKRKYDDPPPIVMLTGAGGERTAVKAFRSGFADYVTKRNLNSSELIGAIRTAIKRKSAERMHQAEYDRLARDAEYDAVTGLYGRRFVEQRLAEMVADAERRRAECALIMISLAEYDEINEHLGRAQGDRALRAFATRLKRVVRPADFCGRYAQGSFAYLIDRDGNPLAMTRLSAQLADELSFEVNLDAVSLRLTPAIGAAVYPHNGSTAAELVAVAQAGARPSRPSSATFVPAAPPLQPQSVEDAPAAQASSVQASGVRTTDRRKAPRQRVLKRGQIMTRDLASAIDCTIRDISTGGARLRVDNYFAAPDEFELLILTTGTRRHVRTRWQIGNEVGVEFMD